MSMITVTVGDREYRARIDKKDDDWRDAAARAIRRRYGKNAKAWSWVVAEHDGQRSHVAAVVGKEDELGGHVEILGDAIYTEERRT